MTDIHTTKVRSFNMSMIRSKDTNPELVVRKYLFKQGLRFRVNDNKLPGKPDVVLTKYKIVIFINGCFWHGHMDCKYATIPATRSEFWQSKINYNRDRDIKNENNLKVKGWKVLNVWECALKNNREESLISLLGKIISNIEFMRKSNNYESNQV